MGSQRQILDQPTTLSLRRITRTQHAPVTGLQCSRPCHFPRFFHLRGNPRHHSQRVDITLPAQDLRHTRSGHVEPFQNPISRRERPDKPLSNIVSDEGLRIKSDPVCDALASLLLQRFVNLGLKVVHECFEEIFEEEGHQLAGEFESFVAVVVLVVEVFGVVGRLDYPADHEGQVAALCFEGHGG